MQSARVCNICMYVHKPQIQPNCLLHVQAKGMYMRSPQACSLLSSPFQSPNVAALLKIKILSWSKETGFPVCIRVRVANRTFSLHKHPFASKSGYFMEKLNGSNEVELPPNFPGGAETFEMIALFVYGSSTMVDPFNVAALRCAAEYLRMTEDYAPGNLCERFDIYLNQVVLQSWNDTLIVLQKCQTLLPWAEDLLIVSRCIETLAFMACMEILDPEQRRDLPVVTMEALAAKPWTDQTVKDIVRQDLWIKDLVALPLSFFKRVIGSLRRQGMKEKYVSPMVLFYADTWVISKRKDSENSAKDSSGILQEVIHLLPMGVRACNAIPIGIYFSLLSASLELGLRTDSVEKLQNHIAPMLHLAGSEHFLQLRDGNALCIMEGMFSSYFSCSMQPECIHAGNACTVAESWDAYLNQIAADSELACQRFTALVEMVPLSSRRTHDHLYKALNTFLQSHPNLSQEDKDMVCKSLNCQKLSQDICIEAVQNELMPLRLIIQALFVQQVNTQQAFRECSDSFRYTHFGEFSGSLSSSRCANSRSQNLVESPYVNGSEGSTRSLNLLLQKDLSVRKVDVSSEISRKEYESTSFRIQNLEQELISLKRSLQLQQVPKEIEKGSKKVEPVSENLETCVVFERRASKRNNPSGLVTGCVGNVSLASHRKYANRLLKLFRRMGLLGRGRSKRMPGFSGVGSTLSA